MEKNIVPCSCHGLNERCIRCDGRGYHQREDVRFVSVGTKTKHTPSRRGKGRKRHAASPPAPFPPRPPDLLYEAPKSLAHRLDTLLQTIEAARKQPGARALLDRESECPVCQSRVQNRHMRLHVTLKHPVQGALLEGPARPNGPCAPTPQRRAPASPPSKTTTTRPPPAPRCPGPSTLAALCDDDTIERLRRLRATPADGAATPKRPRTAPATRQSSATPTPTSTSPSPRHAGLEGNLGLPSVSRGKRSLPDAADGSFGLHVRREGGRFGSYPSHDDYDS